MVCFLGKWDVPGYGSQSSANSFEWTRLPSMLTIEPAVPRNRIRLEDAHFLRDSNQVYILCQNTCICHHLLDGLARHATRHFHPAQAFLRDCRKYLPILQNGGGRRFAVDDSQNNHSVVTLLF